MHQTEIQDSKHSSHHNQIDFDKPLYRPCKTPENERIAKEEKRLINEIRPQRARIFKNDFLESLTLVRPQTIFIFWVPVIFLLFYRNISTYHHDVFSFIGITFSGIITWTLAEYLIHRYPFHWSPKNKLGRQLVYSMHGNHHDDPFDPLRGVMPIVPAIFYVSILYGIFFLFIPLYYLDAFFAGFLIGYLCYDGIHYYTHHAKPKNKLGKYLRRIHLVHHVHDDVMFGISSPLWDIIFGTYLKKGYRPPKEF